MHTRLPQAFSNANALLVLPSFQFTEDLYEHIHSPRFFFLLCARSHSLLHKQLLYVVMQPCIVVTTSRKRRDSEWERFYLLLLFSLKAPQYIHRHTHDWSTMFQMKEKLFKIEKGLEWLEGKWTCENVDTEVWVCLSWSVLHVLSSSSYVRDVKLFQPII